VDREECFTALWTRAVPAIRSFLVALTGDLSLADDVMQEVAIALLRQFDDYDHDKPFVAWALRIARNKAIDSLRARTRSPVLFNNELVEAAAQIWEPILPDLEIRTRALRACIEGLMPKSREVLRLHYEGNHKTHVIAELLGMSAVSVRVALNRARSMLRDCINTRVASEPGL
jgi:RNA polymerase sigma-70 factor, ECF subfamily